MCGIFVAGQNNIESNTRDLRGCRSFYVGLVNDTNLPNAGVFTY